MAIASLDAAKTQYAANLRYWESTDTAANLLEAVLYLIQDRASSYSVAGRSVTRESLLKLQDALTADVKAASTNSRPAMFTRGRITGLGV